MGTTTWAGKTLADEQKQDQRRYQTAQRTGRPANEDRQASAQRNRRQQHDP
jgi:hypothetical protein